MVARVNLHEPAEKRLKRLLNRSVEAAENLKTRPHGVKNLGRGGDLVWDSRGWIVNPEDPNGPLIPGPSWETWSVKEIPKLTETLSADLSAAEQRIADARDELDGIQDAVAGVTVDVATLTGQVSDAVSEAEAAQTAAAAAVAEAQAATAAAVAAEAAAQQAINDLAEVAGKKHVIFSDTEPAEDQDALWIDTSTGQPHRWDNVSGAWMVVTDTRITEAAQAAADAHAEADAAASAAAAAEAAAAAAQAAAEAAQDTADNASSAAAQALVSASGRNSRIISLDPPSGTVNPTTGNPLVEGDTWWQWDTVTDRNVVGAWVWRSGGWMPETLADSVLGSLDVNKLMVLGTARITEAVVSKIMGDAAFFNAIKVEDLTVTGSATIDEAVVAKMAAALIVTQVLRTEVDSVTGLYSIMDSYGFRVIDNDGGPEGTPIAIVKLGPDGDQLIQLGQGDNLVSINSSGGISARTASVHELWLDGRQLRADDMFGGPRGIVSHALLFPGRSRRLNGRDTVLGLEGTLRPGRVYKLETSSMVVDTEHGSCEPFAQLHLTIDGSAPQFNWGGTARKESKVGPYAGFRAIPGMIHWIDLTDRDPDGPNIPLRAAISLGNFANNGWVQAAAVVDRLWMVCEDWGDVFPNRGTPFYFEGGTGGTPPPVRQTTRWTASSMATYVRGGARDQSSGYVQGQYSSWNRETLLVFPSMTSALSGATIHRITCRSFFDSWYYSAGGTASWCWHAETGIPATSPAKTFMVDTAGWPRGAAREINIIPEEFDDWQNGTRRGFIFSTPVTALSHYGRLSSDLNQHWIEVEYSK